MKPLHYFLKLKEIIFFLLFISCATVHAQILIGPKAGINFSSWHGEGSEGAKSKTGFHAGAIFQIPVSEGVSVQPELEFSLEGVKSEDIDFDVSLNYLNLPLLLRYKSFGGFYTEFGFLYGVLLSARGKLGGRSADIKELFKNSDFALSGGLGYQHSSNMGIGMRYNFGLANVYKEEDPAVGNGVLQLSVFYLFNTKAKKQKK